MRLIDADKLLAMVKKNAPFIYHVILPIVALTHTEDAEPVRHGEWIKTRKHLWKKDEDGEINEWAWEHGFHNGAHCEICYKTPCVHCEPDYDEKQDCHEHYMCSECGRIVIDLEPYCHCGARMDGGK